MSHSENNGVSAYFVNKYDITLQNLTRFRKIQDERILDINLEIPAPSVERSVTDKKGFLIYGIALLLFLPVMIQFAVRRSDIRIILKMFDRKTEENQERSFFLGDQNDLLGLSGLYKSKSEGLDSMDKTGVPRSRSVSDYGSYDYQIVDFDDGEAQDPWHYSKKSWWKFLLSVAATIVVCTLVLFLLKCCPHLLVWLAIASIFGLLVALIHVARKLSDTFDEEKYPTSPQFLIVMICIVFTVTCFTLLFFRRHLIHISCFLYQEASRAIFPLSKLWLLTLPTLPIQLIILSFSLLVALAIMAPSESGNRFKYGHAKGFFLLLDILITNWIMRLVGGFQCMVTAESVASRYFLGNWRICRSFGNIFKHHLGTVAFGTAIQPVVAIIDGFVRFCSCYRIDGCTYFLPLELRLAPYSNKIAYIMSALHGQSYLKSGKRAFNLLITYAPFFYALKFRGGVILLVMKLDLIFYCTGISYLLFSNSDDVWLPTMLCLFANTVIVSIFIETVETAAHTLIISECENKFIEGDPSRACQFLARNMATIFTKSEQMYEHELKDREKECCQVRFY